MSNRAARRRGEVPRRERPAWVAPLAIALVGLVIRIVYVLQARANPQFAAPSMDAGYHDEWAWQLAQGIWQGGEPFFRAPLYPMFLSAIYAVAGHDHLMPRLVQAVIGAGSCLLVFAIGQRLFSRTVGLAAASMMALHGTMIYFENELLIPVLFIALVLGFFFLFLKALDDTPRQWLVAAAAGLCFGLAAITRPNILVFLPVLLMAGIPRPGFALRRASLALMLLVAAVPIGAVTAYNAIEGDDLVFIASQGGVNFYIGNNPGSDGRTAVVPGTRPDWWGGRFDTIQIAEQAAGRDLKASEVSDYWFARAFEYIGQQPGDWLKLMLRKLGMFWTGAEIGNNTTIGHVKSYAPIMDLPLLGFGVVAPLGLAGVWLAVRARRRRAWLAVAFIALYMAGVVMFFVNARFRLPVVPFLILFAAYAVVEGWRTYREGARGRLVPAAVIVVVAGLAINLSARSYSENMAYARYRDGLAYRELGQPRQAAEAWRDALRIDPDLAQARTNLANLLASRGDRDAAREAYEAACSADPTNLTARANLASWHLDAGDLVEAERHVQVALERDRMHSQSLRVLGVIRERQDRYDEARRAYLKALEHTREAHRIENNLGALAARQERFDEARAHFERATELAPGYAMAWLNLGAMHARRGDLPAAEQAMRQATRADEGSAEAWSALSRVQAALGRDREAARSAATARRLQQ